MTTPPADGPGTPGIRSGAVVTTVRSIPTGA